MISDHITKAERFMCVKAGALAFAGLMDAEAGPVPQTKSAGFIDGASKGADAAKSIALLAALSAGIPIGVFSHVMGRRIAGRRLREDELKEKIRLYRTAADEMASGLSGGEV